MEKYRKYILQNWIIFKHFKQKITISYFVIIQEKLLHTMNL